MRKVPETARSVLHEEGYTLHSLRVRSMDADEYQRMVFDRQIAQEAATPRPFVADRGLDNLAYASEYGRCFGELAAREEVQKYVEAQRADVVFLVRPHRALRAEDGVRVLPSWEEQQRLDAKIELLLQLWGVPHVVIAENSAARGKNRLIGASLRGVHETWMSKEPKTLAEAREMLAKARREARFFKAFIEGPTDEHRIPSRDSRIRDGVFHSDFESPGVPLGELQKWSGVLDAAHLG